MLQAAVRPVLLVQGIDDQFSFLFCEIKHVEEAFRFWLSPSVSDTSDEDNSSTLRWSLSPSSDDALQLPLFLYSNMFSISSSSRYLSISSISTASDDVFQSLLPIKQLFYLNSYDIVKFL